MGTRRAFLQATAAMTAATAAHAGSMFAPSLFNSAPVIPLYRVVVDGRFEESVAFAREAQGLGNAVSMTDGDVTRLWYEELEPRWRSGAAAIAGLTAHGPLFCLERWSWDHGMRVVLRIDHQRKRDGRVRHFVAAGGAIERLHRRLTAAGGDYPAVVARAVNLCPQSSYQVISPREVICEPADPEPLISWVIAARDRA